LTCGPPVPPRLPPPQGLLLRGYANDRNRSYRRRRRAHRIRRPSCPCSRTVPPGAVRSCPGRPRPPFSQAPTQHTDHLRSAGLERARLSLRQDQERRVQETEHEPEVWLLEPAALEL